MRSPSSSLRRLGSLVVFTGLMVPRPVRADDVYFTTTSLLSDFFSASEHVTYVRLETGGAARELKRLLGYIPPKPTYLVFVAKTGTRIDGYAVIDEEMGQHLPITFGVKLLPSGVVERMEVMVYREGYGDEVREPRFRRQFSGKGEHDPLRFGEDVVAISGATISSKAMAIGVRRAVALVQVVRGHQLDGAIGTAEQAAEPQNHALLRDAPAPASTAAAR